MGYLSKCHACNGACDSGVRYCPWCGKSDPVETGWMSVFWSIVFGFIGYILYFLF